MNGAGDASRIGRTVLVVEDDRDVRESIVEVLEEEGFAVTAAANGAEAIEQLRQSTALPGLILLDLMMPQMDGLQFRDAQRQVKDWASIPVILMTADGRVDDKADQLDAAV